MKNYIGIDLGGTFIKMGVVSENGALLKKLSLPTGAENGADAVIDVMGAGIGQLLREAGVTEKEVSGIGIGCPGYIDSSDGSVYYSNNLKWRNVELSAGLKKYTRLPVFVNNDANVAAIGESVFGAAKDYSFSVFITLGTGVGSGIIINNRIYEGYKSSGTELGHVKIGDKGHRCTCGRLDCWETYSSATALTRDTKHAMLEDPDSLMWEFSKGDLANVDGRTSFECAKKGDKTAEAVVSEYIRYLGDGIVNALNIFGAEAVLIGGGICAQGDYLIQPLKRHVEKYRYGGDVCPFTPVIERASLGNDAGTLGGAALAISMLK